MKNKALLNLLILLLFQVSFSQKKDVKIIIKEASEAFNNNDYERALQKIDEIKIAFKTNTPPPFILSMEIISKSEIIKNNPLDSFDLITDTRNLTNRYLKNSNSKKDTYYNTVVLKNEILKTYPKDLATFNELKAVELKAAALIKEREERAELERQERLKQEAIAIKARQEREASERIKQIEEEKLKKVLYDRKKRLRPYVNPENFSEYELARFSEAEFNERLDEAIKESIEKAEEEKRIKEIENERLAKLQPYIDYVSAYDRNNLGTFEDTSFDAIYLKAKKDFKAAERRNRPQLAPFSSIGFQSGEIAKYGFIYETGGRNTVGFRFSVRTSSTPEEDILNGTIVENKTEIELGPNFKLSNRVYLNIGIGIGNYDRLMNNDYAGEVYIENTAYSVATTGIMFRLSRVISINGGVSFMDIEKDLYKPEITFGISFNLKSKYSY